MDFYDLLDQVIDLIKNRKRVTYRALKVQFRLDDATLEALKDEIIEAQQVARDEDGRILVWIGEVGTEPVSPPRSTMPAPQKPAPHVRQAPPVVSPPPIPPTPEAERRQLTVMFCDLVGSTRLSGQLDPEDLREVIRAYQTTCSEVISHYEGHVAQLLGDGLLVYFGYPTAHEDDAQRALRTGLGIIAAIKNLNTRLEREQDVSLAVRLGVHTGLVVIGDMGSGGHQERLALGETPNIAARIQGLAEPDTLIVSATTCRLAQDFFDFDALGEHALKGVSEPINVYRVLQPRNMQSRLDTPPPRNLTPLVGREQELGLLIDRWQRIRDGQGQVILLHGEAGIGKSRLVQALRHHLTEGKHLRLECRSSPYYHNTALYPITDLLQRNLQWAQEETSEAKLTRLETFLQRYRLPLEETVLLCASLFSFPVPADKYTPLNVTPQRQRQKTLEMLVTMLLEDAERQPVCFILEDLHWCDPTTLEFLGLLINQTPTASLGVLLTYRPIFHSSWAHRSYLTEISLSHLARNQIERLIAGVTEGKSLPQEVLQHIVEKTDGVPLFIEEMTKALVESGYLKDVGGEYEVVSSFSSIAIPATFQDALMARLDRLGTAKSVAQLGATIGRQFTFELLRAVSPMDEERLQQELGRLVGAELLYQRGIHPQITYTFKHALIQDVSYQSLLRSTRQQYHQHIGQVLEQRFAEVVTHAPALLAQHYTEANLPEQAVQYWRRASEQTLQQSAYIEAMSHIKKGLALLPSLTEPQKRLEHELVFRLALGKALDATQGFAAPEVEQTYLQAQHLCQSLGTTPLLGQVLIGLRRCYFLRGKHREACHVAEQFIHFAETQQDHILLQEAHSYYSMPLFALGDAVTARWHLEREGSPISNPQWLPIILWYLGYPSQALQQNHLLLTDQHHIPSLSKAIRLCFAAQLYQLCRDFPTTKQLTDNLVRLATEQTLPLQNAIGRFLRGWALCHAGEIATGLLQMSKGLYEYRTAGAEMWTSLYWSIFAECYSLAEQPDEGLQCITEGLQAAQTNEEHCWKAELYRLKGILLQQQGSEPQSEVENCFYHSLSIARSQQAKSFELRTATSLAKLWQSQGKRQEAHDLLAPIYTWFTEGFDTVDLKDAKALLDELA